MKGEKKIFRIKEPKLACKGSVDKGAGGYVVGGPPVITYTDGSQSFICGHVGKDDMCLKTKRMHLPEYRWVPGKCPFTSSHVNVRK